MFILGVIKGLTFDINKNDLNTTMKHFDAGKKLKLMKQCLLSVI